MMSAEPPVAQGGEDYDCFICHASEDKQTFVDALAHQLQTAGCKAWYDDFVLKVGDSIRRKIEEGLARSRHGVVVLSPHFFRKDWPQQELDGLAALARERGILPVWLDVTDAQVRQHSPMLAGLRAAKSSDGLDAVVNQLLDAMGLRHSASTGPVVRPYYRDDRTGPLWSDLHIAVAKRGLVWVQGKLDEKTEFVTLLVRGSIPPSADIDILADMHARGHVIGGVHVVAARRP